MRRRLALVVLLAAVLAVTGCGSGSSDETETPTTPSSKQDGVQQLTDLTSVEQLRTRFNDERGAPRLILLLSPT